MIQQYFIYKDEEYKNIQIKFNFSTGKLPQKSCVYIVESLGYFKIGKSISWEYREKQLSTGKPPIMRYKPYFVINTLDANLLEQHLHFIFKDKRLNGEWFDLDFTDLVYINNNYNNDKLKYYQNHIYVVQYPHLHF